MRSFDFYIELADENESTRATLWNALSETEELSAAVDDPSRLVYSDQDTAVHFSLIVRRDLIIAEESEDDWEEGRGTDVLPDDHEDSEEDDYEDDDEDDDEDEDQEDDVHAEMPLVVLNVPILRPTFFVEQALEFLESLRAKVPLRLIHPENVHEVDGDAGNDSESEEAPEIEYGPDDAIDRERLHSSWRALNLGVLAAAKDTSALSQWSQERARRFYEYGKSRHAIAAAVSDPNVEVPIAHPAQVNAKIVSLVLWDLRQAIVMPRCDVVLVQRPVEKRGLLRKKTVIEERSVDGSEVWDLLCKHGEFRSSPVEHVLFRPSSPLPQELESALDAMESLGPAKRNQLGGVIDEGWIPVEQTREAE